MSSHRLRSPLGNFQRHFHPPSSRHPSHSPSLLMHYRLYPLDDFQPSATPTTSLYASRAVCTPPPSHSFSDSSCRQNPPFVPPVCSRLFSPSLASQLYLLSSPFRLRLLCRRRRVAVIAQGPLPSGLFPAGSHSDPYSSSSPTIDFVSNCLLKTSSPAPQISTTLHSYVRLSPFVCVPPVLARAPTRRFPDHCRALTRADM